jgi:hypothetical protein
MLSQSPETPLKKRVDRIDENLSNSKQKNERLKK